jgi:hypothetical protein
MLSDRNSARANAAGTAAAPDAPQIHPHAVDAKTWAMRGHQKRGAWAHRTGRAGLDQSPCPTVIINDAPVGNRSRATDATTVQQPTRICLSVMIESKRRE